MGCPDWPKCFGLLVPPTEASQVTWTPGPSTTKAACSSRTTRCGWPNPAFVARDFDEAPAANGSPTLKHDYATLNAAHTWIEFINRCPMPLRHPRAALALGCGAVTRPAHHLARPARRACPGLRGLLGSFVVDGNLILHKNTIHMLSALAILCIDSVIIQRLRGLTVRWHRSARWGLAFALAVTLAQILSAPRSARSSTCCSSKVLVDSGPRDVPRREPRAVPHHRSGYWVVLAVHAFRSGDMGPSATKAHVLRARNVVVLLLIGQLPRARCFAYGAFLGMGATDSPALGPWRVPLRRGAFTGAQPPAEWPAPQPPTSPWALKPPLLP